MSDDLLGRYGPNMARLEQAIAGRLSAASASKPGASETGGAGAPARDPSFARVLAEGRMAALPPRPGRSLPPGAEDPSRSQHTPEQIEEARRTAEEFEAFFISRMLQPMFQELNTDPPFGGGNGERIWRSLMVDEYGSMIARKGGLGIADAVMREMLKTQET